MVGDEWLPSLPAAFISPVSTGADGSLAGGEDEVVVDDDDDDDDDSVVEELAKSLPGSESRTMATDILVSSLFPIVGEHNDEDGAVLFGVMCFLFVTGNVFSVLVLIAAFKALLLFFVCVWSDGEIRMNKSTSLAFFVT